MKRRKKAVGLLVAAAVLCADSLQNESGRSWNLCTVDSGSSYKEIDEYTEQTDSTKEEAENLYENNIDQMMTIAGYDSAGLSDELLDNYRQLFKDMLALAEYEVGRGNRRRGWKLHSSCYGKAAHSF